MRSGVRRRREGGRQAEGNRYEGGGKGEGKEVGRSIGKEEGRI